MRQILWWSIIQVRSYIYIYLRCWKHLFSRKIYFCENSVTGFLLFHRYKTSSDLNNLYSQVITNSIITSIPYCYIYVLISCMYIYHFLNIAFDFNREYVRFDCILNAKCSSVQVCIAMWQLLTTFSTGVVHARLIPTLTYFSPNWRVRYCCAELIGFLFIGSPFERGGRRMCVTCFLDKYANVVKSLPIPRNRKNYRYIFICSREAKRTIFVIFEPIVERPISERNL